MNESPVETAGALAMLSRASWASRTFAEYRKDAVDRIVEAVASAAQAHAGEYAEWAVRETGFGVAEHKKIKNIACSKGIADAYREHDYVSPRVDADAKLVAVPRPAGVVLALTPSTNPVCTLYFKVLLALMTRNAIVISPHPAAREVSVAAARMLAEAADAAGAPDGVIQVLEQPSIPLVEALMADERTNVVVATGGSAMVRAAYRSGTPALGVGPANVPVLVDGTADLPAAARRIVESKSFDNSVLCTNESVLIVEDSRADQLLKLMAAEGAHLLDEAETDRLRAAMFPGGHFDTRFVGRDARWIAGQVGIPVGANCRVLVAPIELAMPEEPLAHEKLCPVLGLIRVPSVQRGIASAKAVLRITGAGHSAAIHSTDPATILAYSAALPVLRVTVNVGNSLGSSGFETNLAPSMTIGTGFPGRSSAGANLAPEHLVNWTNIAYNADSVVPFGDFTGLDPWHRSPEAAVPPYPHASNALTSAPPSVPTADGDAAFREQLRRLIVEELAQIMKG